MALFGCRESINAGTMLPVWNMDMEQKVSLNIDSHFVIMWAGSHCKVKQIYT